MTWLWFALACSMLVLALWPFGPYQLSLLAAARLKRFPQTPNAVGDEQNHRFAVLMCAYNEAGCIKAKVDDLLRLRAKAGGDLDILVYVDGASDDTAHILESFGDQIRLFVSTTRQGKTAGMNMMVRESDASIIVFTDANVMVDHDAIAVLRHYFSDPEIGCVCSSLTYTNAKDSSTADVGSAFWNLNEWSKSLETATGSVIGADGSLFAIRRALHKPVPDGLIDDIYVSFQVLFQGKRVVRAPELRAFETHTTDEFDEFRRKIRIACECMHVHFRTFGQWRQGDFWNLYKYIGHRLLRWLGGYLLLLAGLFVVLMMASIIGWLMTMIVLALGLCMFALLLQLSFGPACKVWNALLAFAGVSIGVAQACFGKRAITWNVPLSSRQAMASADRVKS